MPCSISSFTFFVFTLSFLCCRRGGKGGLVGDETSSVANVRTFLYFFFSVGSRYEGL
jgi:hypothetical protein